MAIANAASGRTKSVSDPNAAYESLRDQWTRMRAVCSGERFVKDLDDTIDTTQFKNILIPFSPSMTSQQYNFYRAEAEWPGVIASYVRTLMGGLLRKQPVLKLPEELPVTISDWLMHSFGKDDSSMLAFLNDAVWEEIQTSRCWIFLDHPKTPSDLSAEEQQLYKPYPLVRKAEEILNTKTTTDQYGKTKLCQVVVGGRTAVYGAEGSETEFHPVLTDTVWVHDLDSEGCYRIRKYMAKAESTTVPVIAGQVAPPDTRQKRVFELIDTNTSILMQGERPKFIPAWPLNGSIEPLEPMLMALSDKEVALYNKMSRRNHLLYGAATYTPVISSDMTDEEFDDIVEQGLGSWIKLRSGESATVLDTPTAALQDMDRAIASSLEEIAKLGVRMLTPETDQSGVALEIRNAGQTSQLGLLNARVSETMRQVIGTMIYWRTGVDLALSAIGFSLSADFNPTPLGADWLRLATEWYSQGLIPRSVWIDMIKQNDMLEPGYDDVEGQKEINAEMMERQAQMVQNNQFAQQMQNDIQGGPPNA